MNAPEVEAFLTYLIQADEGERVAIMDLIRERIWGAVRVPVRPERAMRSADLAALVAVAPHEIEPGRWLAELDGYQGVWAIGDSPDACRTTLSRVLEGWLAIKRAHNETDIPGEADQE
jgi:predicted RNase H-like HicB family nuclease